MKTSELISYTLRVVKRKIKLGAVVVKGLTVHRKLQTESAFPRLNPEPPMTPNEAIKNVSRVSQFILI